MGNIFQKTKEIDYDLEDQKKQLLWDDIDEKINTVEHSMSQKHSQIIQTYNKEINNIRLEIDRINRENIQMVKHVNNLNVIVNDREQKINRIENKLFNIETGDEFLSTVETDIPDIDDLP
jgi:uncharacterized coiled-coil DUF342 family protein